jgi:hypothetical protein
MITLHHRSGELRGQLASKSWRVVEIDQTPAAEYESDCRSCEYFQRDQEKCWDPRCKCFSRRRPWCQVRCPGGKWSRLPALVELAVRTPIDNVTGTGQISCGLIRELIINGIRPRIQPMGRDDSWAPIPRDVSENLITNGTDLPRLNISPVSRQLGQIGPSEAWMTFWETDNPGRVAVEQMNRCKLGLFISEWNRQSFVRAGATVPTAVVHPWVDPVFVPKPLPDNDPFVFLAGGDVEHGGERKGIADIIAAFRLAFPRNPHVRLKIKLRPGCRTPDDSDPRIEMVRYFMAPSKLADWIAAGHVWVNGARGGAWELLPFQAMAIGRPVIAAEYGGQAEYFDVSVGWPVDYEVVPATGWYSGRGNWAVLSIASMAEQMRRSFFAPAILQEKGQAASARAQQFSRQRSGKELVAALQSAGIVRMDPVHAPVVIKKTWPTFYHAGDIGDALFGLWIVKALGGGILHLGPNVNLPAGLNPRDGITGKAFQFMAPLLHAQPYVRDLHWTNTVPKVDYDLNEFRLFWRHRLDDSLIECPIGDRPASLFWMHLARFGFSACNESEPWLTVEPKKIDGHPVIIHRSFRARNDAFNWRRVLESYGSLPLFLGLKNEHDDFERRFGQVEFYHVEDSLEMAQILAGCRLFVGNTSCPHTIAEALKIPIIEETRVTGGPADNIFHRPGVQYCRQGDEFTLPPITL